MITKVYTVRAKQNDPYRNLALEECLLDAVKDGQCILYLWQNKRTVVIGRNQNAAAECRIRELEADGGHLARRLSGGGAVYHDLGNVNFTFLLPSADFDAARQADIILDAVKALGIPAEKNGRNDLTANGRKFSGHAYYHRGGKSYHHGTLMLTVNRADLERYLNVPAAKLADKGVKSVRSRVCNLSEFVPRLTAADMADALTSACAAAFGCRAKEFAAEDIDPVRLEEKRKKYASAVWKYGRNASADLRSREKKFSWGLVRVDFSVKDGMLTKAVLWSDGLDADFLSEAAGRMTGVPFEKAALAAALGAKDAAQKQMAEDIAELVAGT